MKSVKAIPFALAIFALTLSAGVQSARSQTSEGGTSSGEVDQKFALTVAQRSAIYAAVSNDKSEIAPKRFPAAVGADVPPLIELHALPNDVVAGDPAVKYYEYTMMQDEVVLVDPKTMRVIGIIGPAPQQ
jgi:hypothetical protein